MTSETRTFLDTNGFIHSNNLNHKKLPPYEVFHDKLRKCNLLEQENRDYKKLICSGLTTESALVKMRLSEKPPTGA